MFEVDEVVVFGELLEMGFDFVLMEVGEELSFLYDCYLLKLFKQFKCGYFSVQDDFDLYYMNVVVVQVSIVDFLVEVWQNGLCCVCIVYGKGLWLKLVGLVLKLLIDCMLCWCDEVIVFVLVWLVFGGMGVVVVLLKC